MVGRVLPPATYTMHTPIHTEVRHPVTVRRTADWGRDSVFGLPSREGAWEPLATAGFRPQRRLPARRAAIGRHLC